MEGGGCLNLAQSLCIVRVEPLNAKDWAVYIYIALKLLKSCSYVMLPCFTKFVGFVFIFYVFPFSVLTFLYQIRLFNM